MGQNVTQAAFEPRVLWTPQAPWAAEESHGAGDLLAGGSLIGQRLAAGKVEPVGDESADK